MSEVTYLPFQKLRTTATFTDSSGVAANSSTITLTITRSLGGTNTQITTKNKAQLQNPSTGQFYYEYTPGTDGPGTYYFNWVSTTPDTEQEEHAVVETPHR